MWELWLTIVVWDRSRRFLHRWWRDLENAMLFERRCNLRFGCQWLWLYRTNWFLWIYRDYVRNNFGIKTMTMMRWWWWHNCLWNCSVASCSARLCVHRAMSRMLHVTINMSIYIIAKRNSKREETTQILTFLCNSNSKDQFILAFTNEIIIIVFGLQNFRWYIVVVVVIMLVPPPPPPPSFRERRRGSRSAATKCICTCQRGCQDSYGGGNAELHRSAARHNSIVLPNKWGLCVRWGGKGDERQTDESLVS